MQAIKNAQTYDFESYKENQYVLFDQRITDVGPMSNFSAIQKLQNIHDSEVFDAKNRLLIPGLVLSHTHTYSSFARGMSIPFNPKNFLEVLERSRLGSSSSG